ncbi:MAG TPA: DUF3221 domain-containing protein [Gemmatimonadaceae bacterium]|nr:DUF3221 domain-containing protein [Gemmatimonadaceae bacterium]
MRTAATLSLLYLLAACATRTALPDRDPAITGFVTEIATHAGAAEGVLGEIRVEANPADSAGSPKYVLTITDETVLLLRPDEITERLPFEQLVVGQRVDAWVTGPVMESYPARARASHVLIHGEQEAGVAGPTD